MKEARYIFPEDYMADPSAHVYNGKVYIYPSHDWDSGTSDNDNGDQYNMKDYHCLSIEDLENGTCKDEGVILRLEDVPWAKKQLWDSDVVEKTASIIFASVQRTTTKFSILVLPLPTDQKARLRLNQHQSLVLIPSTLVCLRMMMVAFMFISVVFGAVSCNATAIILLWKTHICQTSTTQHFLHVWQR